VTSPNLLILTGTNYISVFILVSSISYRYTSTDLATVVVFFFTGATVSAKLALSVLFTCCRLSCFDEIVFMNK